MKWMYSKHLIKTKKKGSHIVPTNELILIYTIICYRFITETLRIRGWGGGRKRVKMLAFYLKYTQLILT